MSTDQPVPPTEHSIRIFPIAGTSKHVAACSCGKSVTSTDAATAISDLIGGGCRHWSNLPDIPPAQDND